MQDAASTDTLKLMKASFPEGALDPYKVPTDSDDMYSDSDISCTDRGALVPYNILTKSLLQLSWRSYPVPGERRERERERE